MLDIRRPNAMIRVAFLVLMGVILASVLPLPVDADSKPPELHRAEVDGNTLVLSYTEALD